jgi:hypothetical protein
VTAVSDAALSLRPAREADGPAIGAIKVASWRRAYAGILPAEALDGLDVARESADRGAYAGARPADDRLIVACMDDMVVGYGRSEPSPDREEAARWPPSTSTPTRRGAASAPRC